MDVLAVVLCAVIIIILVSLRAGLNNKIYILEKEILGLRDLLNKALANRKDQETVSKPASTEADTPVMVPKPAAPPERAAEPAFEEPKPNIFPEPAPKIIDRPVKTGPVISAPSAPRPSLVPPKFTPAPPRQPKPSFFEQHPDIEKFIGENLLNKIGIGIFVLAVGYFVKYAIDSNWIGPVGRVGIGFVCGGILLGFAHRLRNNYNAFSSVLVGGGIAVFYLTITLGFQQFHLFSQTVAFVILVIITGFAVALSLLYNRQELAVIALIGGLASPFMASNGGANYHALFIYMLILNTGLLVIAYNKAWRILNVLAFALSQIIYISAVCTVEQKAGGTVLLYGCLFYLLYFAINIAHNVRESNKFIASDFGILLANTAIYFAAGLYLLTYIQLPQYRGLFSAAMGVLNLAASYILLKNKKVDTNILYLLIGITITFISLTAPIQLHGNNITLFWASEAVLLYWLSQRSGIVLMRYTALGIWVIMLISLVMDVSQVYYYFTVYDLNPHRNVMTIIANRGFITMLYAATSTFILSVLMGHDSAESKAGFGINKNIIAFTALGLLFLSGLLELNYQFASRYPDLDLNVLYALFYTCAFALVLDIVAVRLADVLNNIVRFLIIAAVVVIYLAAITNAFDVQSYMLTRNTLGIHFLTHWLNAAIIGVLFVRLISIFRKNFIDNDQPFSWICTVLVILFLSLEVNLVVNAVFYSPKHSLDDILHTYIRTGLPILWGVYSFALMWLGMRYKYKPLRIISLTLFSITLLKLFIFDLSDISEAGKIVAFGALGLLLLIMSFMYQKLKKIIVADEDKPAE